MRALLIAASALLIAQVGTAQAAGPFDGTWKGGSAQGGVTSSGRPCPATTATVTIADGKITGSYTSLQYTFNIGGFVKPDGSASGKWSAYPFSGSFNGTHFKGTYTSKECGAGREIFLDKQ